MDLCNINSSAKGTIIKHYDIVQPKCHCELRFYALKKLCIPPVKFFCIPQTMTTMRANKNKISHKELLFVEISFPSS